MKSLFALAGLSIVLVLAGCEKQGVMSKDLPKPPDPYAGMSKEQRIQAIQQDPKLNDFQRKSMIADVEKGP